MGILIGIFKVSRVGMNNSETVGTLTYICKRVKIWSTIDGVLPIRKIAPGRVALTSYYGKIFISRSEKRVDDYGEWLRNAVMAKGLTKDDPNIKNLHPASVFDSGFVCPRLYSILAIGFRGFTLIPKTYAHDIGPVPFELSFDHTKRLALFGQVAITLYEHDGAFIIGYNQSTESYLIIDKHDTIYATKDGRLIPMPSIESMLDLDAAKAPVDYAVMRVMNKTIPIGVVLGYEMGLERLMKLLRVVPRRVPVGTRAKLAPHEYAIVFQDEALVLSRDDKVASMILSGYNEYHRSIRNYSIHEFEKRGVYLNILEMGGAGVRYLRELDLTYQMFVDPITRDILIEMKEPIDFRGLLLRSCEMLLTDHHPDERDPAFMRIKGYERMAGAIYATMIQSLRAHNSRIGKSKAPIDMNPYAVWKAIAEDPSIALVSDINPIQNLKEKEAVTTGGTGGRNSRSMTRLTRAYHKNSMGTISESTVDSSDVGINTYTSADPQFTSLRGISRRYENGKTGATALLSTSALLAPGSDRDDPKRTNFTGIQHSHGVACKGYTQAPVRTGYEQVIAHRTSDLFAMTAKLSGKVISVTEHGILVEYEDGERKGYELGRRFGNASGLIIPHSVVTHLKAGQAFKAGDLICHNDGFFEKDILNPNNVIWKAGIMVKTALLESTATLEDSSAISKRVSELLVTKTTKMNTIVVNFDQSIKRMIKVGQHVESEDILCVIENAVTANAGLFDEESLDTLRILGNQTPQAKAKGIIERIEVFYHGEKEDMSETLRNLADTSDKELAQRNKALGKKIYTGSVDEGFRIEGDPLALDTMAIRVYITSDISAGVGD